MANPVEDSIVKLRASLTAAVDDLCNSLAVVHAVSSADIAALRASLTALDAREASDVAALSAQISKLEALIPTAGKIKLGAITYYSPGAKWSTLLAKGSQIGFTIINPASGPGTSASAAYVSQVTAARTAAPAATVLGYVATGYGNRPMADVKIDIDRHQQFYGAAGLGGVFFDQGGNTADKIPFYTEACAHAHAKGLKVALNPGTRTLVEYLALVEWLLISESSAAAYRTRVGSAWEATAPASKICHVVHSCSALDMPEMVNLAKVRNCGNLWVTDDTGTNPYDTNPTFLDAFCAKLAA